MEGRARFVPVRNYLTSRGVTTGAGLSCGHDGKGIAGHNRRVPRNIAPKIPQFPRRQPAPARKILLAQDSLDPDVDRKSAQAFVGKEHDAVGHFRADAREGAKLGPEFVVRQFREDVEVDLAAR